MNKLTFTNQEILQLEFELNGGISYDKSVSYDGLLNLNIPLVLKFELRTLSAFLINKTKEIEEIRENLLLKYGTPNEKGDIIVNKFINVYDDLGNAISKKFDDNFVQYDKELDALYGTHIDIFFPDITIDDLREAGRTRDNYKVLFNLVKSSS